MIIFRFAVISCVIFLGCEYAAGQSIAKYAGEFLTIGVGARPQALGASYTAIADGAVASYWNPAGIGQTAYGQISLMHAEHFAGELKYDFVGMILPGPGGNKMGVSIIRLGIDGIPDTRNALIDSVQANGRIDAGERLNINKITYFSNSDWTVLFTFARGSNSSRLFGSNIKIIKRSIGSYNAWGIGFDIGILYKLHERFTIGANLMDATSTVVVWNTGRKELISPLLKVGGCYTYNNEKRNIRILPVADADIRFEGRHFTGQYHVGEISINMHYGLELQYAYRLSFRAGYDDLKQVSIGTGIHVRNMYVDYAYTGFEQYSELGSTHKISMAIDINK